jgi:hypothetical protein
MLRATCDGARSLRVGRGGRPAPVRSAPRARHPRPRTLRRGGGARGDRHARAVQGGCAQARAAPAASAQATQIGTHPRPPGGPRRAGSPRDAFDLLLLIPTKGRTRGRGASQPDASGYALPRKRPKLGTQRPPRSSLAELGARRSFDPFRPRATPTQPRRCPSTGRRPSATAGPSRHFADATRTPAGPPPVTARSPTPPARPLAARAGAAPPRTARASPRTARPSRARA